ncbi:protein containing 3D domain protein [gut metagenome]|uniref:Protein containing 3D domain protein n=1 Tax=gut metagenome TaxID=749906 RepID=J9GE49_9ZZZZ
MKFQKGEKTVIGYVPNGDLSDKIQMKKFKDRVTMAKDADILDYPGRKDGQVIGEVLELDEVKRTGTINNIWSRILFQDEKGKKRVGYIPTTSIKGEEKTEVVLADTLDEKKGTGTIHKSKGKGVFAEAVDEVGAGGSRLNKNGVQEGTPMAVSSDAVLRSLGTFRITHYCPCSICCGPWANGITSTGVTATTNHTIAVDPSQIPYGTKVVINGQVYVAEDCGGAIKNNCIDIYVGSHEEGERKGVYYTEVYVIQE